jgi:hypothetical protein
VPIRAPLTPRLLEAGLPKGFEDPPAGPMAPHVGARIDPATLDLEKLAPDDRQAIGRVRAFVVPALVDLVVDIPRTLEANREALAMLARTVPVAFEWKLERPIFGALHKQTLLTFACEAPDDEATGQPMCLVVRGPVTHVEGCALDTPDGRARLERVQRSFSATTDFRATLRSFSMKARIERAVWANVQAPFSG